MAFLRLKHSAVTIYNTIGNLMSLTYNMGFAHKTLDFIVNVQLVFFEGRYQHFNVALPGEVWLTRHVVLFDVYGFSTGLLRFHCRMSIF